MSSSKLPERASLEFLKKLAKDRLQELRRSEPKAKLAAAQLAVAREYGFSSWRAMKAEVDRQQATSASLFFQACGNGDVNALRKLLAEEPSLVRESNSQANFAGTTGLHEAASRGQLEAVRLLLSAGADPNAREDGDNTYPLHWAASHGHGEVIRALLDAGGDVHGFGDLHELDAIGWATYFHPHDRPMGDNPEVIALLVERGAKHHIFSAMAVGDLDLIRRVVEANPKALERRMSRFEDGQTAVHFATNQKRYDILELLLEFGADPEAKDLHGRTALDTAMLRGNREAIQRLVAAGAKLAKKAVVSSDFRATMTNLAKSVSKCIPMMHVGDVGATLDWYKSIGFKELSRYGDQGQVNFGFMTFGKAELMVSLDGDSRSHDLSLWFYTDRVDDIYNALKARQLEAVSAEMAGQPCDHSGITFEHDIYNPFYGGREFSIQDPNGYSLNFVQPNRG